MEEEKVIFETAKLAQEKGFDEISETMFVVNEHQVREQSSGKPYWTGETTIYRPTKSVLQKWLRKIHKINVGMTFHQSNGSDITYDYCLHYPYGSQTKVTRWSQKNFLSYEDALEEALQEGLKIIKIVN